MSGQDHPVRHVELPAQAPRGEEQDGDDAHGLLGVVCPVAEAVGAGRHQLQAPEQPVHPPRVCSPEGPERREHHQEPEHEADQRREHHEQADLEQPRRDERHEPRLDHGGARQPADQRVRRTGRQPPIPCDQVPADRADEGGQDHPRIHDVRAHDAPAHRGRHVHAEAEGGDEVEDGGPHHGLERRQDPRRHHGGDRVGRVVEAVDEVEEEGDGDDEDDERRHGARPSSG